MLNQASQAIPGLYAAGETPGGVLGDRYMGSGNSLDDGSHRWVASLGRIAGTHAVSDTRS